MGKADLHMHSTASDGKFAPARVVEIAYENGLETIALTDHDTLSGFVEAEKKAKLLDIEIISGIEITCMYRKREIHLLGYGFDTMDERMQLLTTKHQMARLKRACTIIDILNRQGLDIDIDEVKAEAASSGISNIGRPHIARVLVRKQYVASVKEAFIRFLSDSVLNDLNPEYYTVEKAMETVKYAGGLVSLAHPNRSFSTEELNALVEMGLDGLEYLHPSHDFELQCFYEKFCNDHYLIKTGGSDFHGYGKDQQSLGIIAVSQKNVQSLKKMIKNRNSVLYSS